MNFPNRFLTGIRNTTIPNPAQLVGHDYEGAETFEGLCSEYNFRKQTQNFAALRRILIENGTDFLYVAATRYDGDCHKNHRFVATAADGSLIWNKYVGYAAQGGQNHVYVAGMRIKVSYFLAFSKEKQAALLSGSEARIDLAFQGVNRFWNETDTLWN